ncbi:MAG TPA: calcium/sodium antiporter [Flavisolibacter sp.]
MLTYILFVIGFVVLIKGADLLVTGATSVARQFHVSDLVIGLTIVAFGTSLPELFVNIFASIDGNPDIAIGNVLGSNIANILLILGISSLIYPLRVQSTTVWKEIPFSLLAAIALGVMANDQLIDKRQVSELTRGDGLMLFAFFAIFLYYIFEIARKSPKRTDEGFTILPNWKSIVFIILGLAGLVLGGNWIVEGAVKIAAGAGVSQSLIGLTVVAIGTSLPELATSAVAAYKKSVDIAIGNVVGSNIFNIFWILGLNSLIKPLPFHAKANVDILMTILASLLLFIVFFIGKRHLLQRWQGALFVMIYAAYLVYLVYRG